MSDEKKVSNVGVIGATYHDKKEDKDCKIVSRDEKCKTVMLEYEDGTSKPVGYSTFRRQFKKVAGPVKEVVEGEDKVVDMKKAAKKIIEKKPSIYKEMYETVMGFANRFDDGAVIVKNVVARRGYNVVVHGVRVAELYGRIRKGDIGICMHEEDFDAMKFDNCDANAQIMPGWTMNATFNILLESLDGYLTDLQNYIESNMASYVEAEKKATELKQKRSKKKADKEAEQSVETEPVEQSVEANTTTEDSGENMESAE